MRWTLILIVAAFLSLGTAYLYAQHDHHGAGENGHPHGGHHGSQHGQMEPGHGHDGEHMQQMMERMQDHMHVMMNLQIDPADPQVLLTLTDALELTEQQIEQLEALTERSRAEAEGILAEQQREQLEEKNIHGHPMKQMHERMHGEAGHEAMQHCPMMQQMHAEPDQNAESAGDTEDHEQHH